MPLLVDHLDVTEDHRSVAIAHSQAATLLYDFAKL
jgi:hypothetical protein